MPAQTKNLYESAALPAPPQSAWLHIGRGTLYMGALGQLKPHRHAVPAYLAGLYGDFELSIQGLPWVHCRTAVVPAGVLHAVRTDDAPVAVWYPQPDQVLGAQVLSLVQGETADAFGSWGGKLGRIGETHFFRELYEHPDSHHWADEALESLLGLHTFQRRTQQIDSRICDVMRALHAEPEGATSVTLLATRYGMSASRFMHVFSEMVGVPYRRYRVWCRLQQAMKLIGQGNTFTNAALAAGFSDSQHFSHHFSQTLGTSASDILRRISRLSIQTVADGA